MRVAELQPKTLARHASPGSTQGSASIGTHMSLVKLDLSQLNSPKSGSVFAASITQAQ